MLEEKRPPCVPAQCKTDRSRTCPFVNHYETLRLRSNSRPSGQTYTPARNYTSSLDANRVIHKRVRINVHCTRPSAASPFARPTAGREAGQIHAHPAQRSRRAYSRAGPWRGDMTALKVIWTNDNKDIATRICWCEPSTRSLPVTSWSCILTHWLHERGEHYPFDSFFDKCSDKRSDYLTFLVTSGLKLYFEKPCRHSVWHTFWWSIWHNFWHLDGNIPGIWSDIHSNSLCGICSGTLPGIIYFWHM